MSEQMVLPLDECNRHGDCRGRVIYSELTDDDNTHWHIRGLLPVSLASLSDERLAQAEAKVRRVEELITANWPLPREAAGAICIPTAMFHSEQRRALRAALSGHGDHDDDETPEKRLDVGRRLGGQVAP